MTRRIRFSDLGTGCVIKENNQPLARGAQMHTDLNIHVHLWFKIQLTG